MDEDQIKEAITSGFRAVRDDLAGDLSQIHRRLEAIVARLDEQDLSHERLMQKVDRLSQNVVLSAQASEQALDTITGLSKRVARLEHPDEPLT